MSWRDRLQPASFRGVPFSVRVIESEFGRRQVTHQAAQVDVPSSEDLGRAADVFQVEGFIVGEDYDTARDALIKAIRDTAGPGRLVHPYQGEKSVLASGFRVREDVAEQRMCRFTVNFGEAGELSQPSEVIDGPNVLASRAADIREEATTNFVDRFNANGFPQFVRESAEKSLAGLGDYLSSPTSFLSGNYTDAVGIFNSVNGIVGGATDFVSENIASFQSDVAGFLQDVSSLVDFPGDLASRAVGLIAGVRSTFGSGAGSILAGLMAYFPRAEPSSSEEIPPAVTPSRAQVVTNDTAITDLVREVAVAELAVAAVGTTFETLDDSVDMRDVVAELIDGEAETTTSDAIYGQMTQARAELIQSLPAPGQTAAQLVPYTTAATLPALVIAQTLYGDATQESQIVRRNRPRHPGFILGGTQLQVLSDGR